jgi:hypothetical protein
VRLHLFAHDYDAPNQVFSFGYVSILDLSVQPAAISGIYQKVELVFLCLRCGAILKCSFLAGGCRQEIFSSVASERVFPIL